MSLRLTIYKKKQELKKYIAKYIKLIRPFDLYKTYFAKSLPIKYVSIKIRGLSSKIYIRPSNDIDLGTVMNTFDKKFHLPPTNSVGDSPVIVDLGANIGMTAIDFAVRYPDSRIIGVEMDTDNFLLAKKNTFAFKNIKLINKAIWIRDEEVKYSCKTRPDGYSIDVSSTQDGMQIIDGITLDSLFKAENIKMVSYLKMDIEGAEREIFFSGNTDWLKNVVSMNIEYHGFSDTDKAKLYDVLKNHGFTVFDSHSHWASIFALREIV